MRRPATALALCLLALLPVAPAQAATRNEIIKDCSDGKLEGTYTPSELRDARQNLPSDVAEYTDCADVLRRAELPDTPGGAGGTPGQPPSTSSGTGGGTGTTPGGTPGTVGATPGGAPGSFVPATPEDFQALTDAQEAGRGGAVVDGRRLVPGLSAGAMRNDVPGTLVAALIVLAVAGLALGAPAARRALPRGRWLPRRRTAP
jgi:hypothetical protein